jgi:hypothetical protein
MRPRLQKPREDCVPKVARGAEYVLADECFLIYRNKVSQHPLDHRGLCPRRVRVRIYEFCWEIIQDGRFAELAPCSGKESPSEDGQMCKLGSIPRPYVIPLLNRVNRIEERYRVGRLPVGFLGLELPDVVAPWPQRAGT